MLSVADAGEAHGGWDASIGGKMDLSVTVAVDAAVDAMEGWRGDGGDVAAFEDAGGSTHAVALGDSAGVGRRCSSGTC